MRDHAKWRANVRKAYFNRTSNPQHRGAWGNPGIYSLFSSYNGGWPVFGPLGPAEFSIEESYSETYTLASTNTRPDTEPVSLTDETTQTVLFISSVDRKDVTYKDYLIPPDEGGTPSDTDKCVRAHSSATPYGTGLYDMAGYFAIDGQEDYTIYQRRETSDGYEGTVSTSIRSRKIIAYKTKYQMLDGELKTPKIEGLQTRIRLMHPEYFHGPTYAQAPVGAPGPPIAILPFELNPDGEDLDGLAVEMYWTDGAAKALQKGTWKALTLRNSGGGGDSFDTEDDDGYVLTTVYNNSFGRSGELKLTVTV